eukprot:3444854-Alexandrium_andersonii.AAC.1
MAVAVHRVVMHGAGAQLAFVNLASAAQQDFNVGTILGPSVFKALGHDTLRRDLQAWAPDDCLTYSVDPLPGGVSRVDTFPLLSALVAADAHPDGGCQYVMAP